MKDEQTENFISEEEGEEIVNRIVEIYDDLTPWAMTAAKEYFEENEDSSLSWTRLVEESRKALWHAMVNYDPDLETDYYKYIIRTVKTKLLAADLLEFTKKRAEKMLAEKTADLVAEIRNLLHCELEREPSHEEIAGRAAEFTAEEVREALKKLEIRELQEEIRTFIDPLICYLDEDYDDTDDESFFS